mmetsp:Transcript_3995/g.10989  ORF Transcript_3995/g.10989 Transcript_3995/m.10989 type:complete len:257 (+) Transcript_3995:2083-2853(+)
MSSTLSRSSLLSADRSVASIFVRKNFSSATSSMATSRFGLGSSFQYGIMRSRMFTILPGTHHAFWLFSMSSRSHCTSPGTFPRTNCTAACTSAPLCVTLRIHKKCLNESIMCGRCRAGPVMPSERQPAFMFFRSSRDSPPLCHRCSQNESQLPVCKKCRYASQILMSSGVVLLCSFWCHCAINGSSMPGRWPSLMPCCRMMLRMPRRMSSPLPPPRGRNMRQARSRARTAPSAACAAKYASRPATCFCMCAMSLPW